MPLYSTGTTSPGRQLSFLSLITVVFKYAGVVLEANGIEI